MVRPFEDGAVHDKATVVLLAERVVVKPVGVSGLLYGMTADEADDAEPEPAALVAVTVNV